MHALLLAFGAVLLQGCPSSPSPGQGGAEPPGERRAVTFSKSFGGAGFDDAHAVSATGDGGYVFVGSVNNSREGADDGDIWISKLDAAGDVQWQRAIGEPRNPINDSSRARQFNSIRPTADGGYILTGTAAALNADSTTGDDVWIAKLDARGTVEWSRDHDGGAWRGHAFAGSQFGRGDYADDEGTDVWPTPDGGYVVAGRSYANLIDDGVARLDAQSVIVLRIDSDGDVLRRHRLTEGQFSGGAQVFQPPIVRSTANGDALVGYAGDFDGRHAPSQARVVRLGASDLPLWDVREDAIALSPPRVLDITQTHDVDATHSDDGVRDDGFVIVVNRHSLDRTPGRPLSVVLKLDRDGHFQWRRLLDGVGLRSVQQLCTPIASGPGFDCEFLLGGHRFNAPAVANDGYVLRLSPLGITVADRVLVQDGFHGFRVDAIASADGGNTLVAAVRTGVDDIYWSTARARRVALERSSLNITSISDEIRIPEADDYWGLGFGSPKEVKVRLPQVLSDGSVLSINPETQSFTRWSAAPAPSSAMTAEEHKLQDRFVGETAHGVVEVAPDSYIVTAETLEFEHPDVRALEGVSSLVVLRITGGRVDWMRRYGAPTTGPERSRGIVAPSGDGGVVILPRAARDSDQVLTKLAGDGSIVWQSAPIQADASGIELKDVQRLHDGGYVVLGAFGGFVSAVYRFDAMGALQWQHEYDYIEASSITPIDEDGNGVRDDGFALVTAEGLATVVKLDRDGVVLWRKEYAVRGATAEAPSVWKIQQTADGSYVIATTESGVIAPDSPGQPFGQSNLLLMALTREGDLRWTQSYGAFLAEKVFDMKALADGFIVAGRSRSLGEGTEAWLLRLGPDGLLAEGCNAYLGSSTGAFRTQTRALSHRSVALAPTPAATPVDSGAAVIVTGVPETVVARQCFGTAGAVTVTTSRLTVTQPGTLTGTVTSTPSGIVCGTASGAGCAASFATGTSALLDVDPSSAVNFLRWEDCDEVIGDASGSPRCRVRMTRDRTVRAVFGQPTDRFALRLAVVGTGTVTSGDSAIRCGVFFGSDQACEAGYDAIIPGTTLQDSINLSVFTNRDDFVGWGGDCSAAGTAAAFNLVMDADKDCIATFAGPPGSLDLTVQTTGTGSGVVTSTPAGISCEVTCTAAFPANETVILFAQPLSGANASAFDGWTGCDRLRQVPGDSIPACEVDMNASRSVAAAFTRGPPPPSTQFTLTVQRVGFTALVMSTPRGIECGLACSASFASNQTVRLAVTPNPGFTLSGWTGCDRMPAGTSAPFDCEVDMTADRTVQVRIE